MNPPLIWHVDATVEYDGRACSTLERGQYLLFWKADGSFQIHGGKLIQPLNYQGAGAVVTYDSGVLKVIRKSETITVTIFQSLMKYSDFRLDDHKIKITKTEEELVLKLRRIIEEGQIVPDAEKITKETPTPYGPIDLCVRDASGCVHVFEVKRKKANIAACTQVKRYAEYLLETLTEQNLVGVRLHLVSPSITAGALKYCQKNNITWTKLDF